ncbi:MAG: hypothetical protein RMM51_07180 [Verrucomicrobiae bacterium]|nr:hypothetical protein [Verrucomicrobiae bacterium]
MIAAVFLEHTIPRVIVVFGLAAAVGFTMWWLARALRSEGAVRWVLVALRGAFLLGLGWCLLRPAWKDTVAQLIRPRVAILLDVSASMSLAAPGQPSRWDVVQQVLRQPWRDELAARTEVEVYPFDAELHGRVQDIGDLVPRGTTTQLQRSLESLRERYRGQPLAAVVVLSDGLDAREPGPVSGWDCPIFTVALEAPAVWEETPDVRVLNVETPRRVVVGWESELTAVVAGSGTGGRVFTVQLLRTNALLAEQPVQLPAEGGARPAKFKLSHPEVGSFTYTVWVPPLANETVTNDNAMAVAVQVVDTKNRLLYLEGPPRFESKFLTRVLQANPAVTPLIFLQGPQGRYFTVGQRGAMTTELTPDQLTQVKILILGDITAAALGEARAQAVVRFVTEGGSLVVLGGARAWDKGGLVDTALRELLPVRRPAGGRPTEGRFALRWTSEGRAHPAFAGAEQLPPVLTVFGGSALAPGAVVLVETEQGDPIIAAQRFGQGKVAVVLTDSLWRWRLEPGTERAYGKFWARMLEWLTPAAEELPAHRIDLSADAEQYSLGQPASLQARLTTETPGVDVQCEIRAPDGRKILFPMTAQPFTAAGGATFQGYRLEFTAPESGLYTATARAQVEGATVESEPVSFYVRAHSPELAPRPANEALLRAISEATGGRYVTPSELAEALRALDLTATEEQRATYRSLWNTWPVLLGLLGLLTAEWFLRKLRNLP